MEYEVLYAMTTEKLELERQLECVASDLYIAETGLKAVLACFKTDEEKFNLLILVAAKLREGMDDVENVMDFIEKNLV